MSWLAITILTGIVCLMVGGTLGALGMSLAVISRRADHAEDYVDLEV